MKRGDFFIFRQAHARPLACFVAAFLMGLLAAKGRPLPLWACLGALAALAALAVALRTRRRAFALLLLAVGFAAGMARMELALDALPAVEEAQSVPMTGHVVSEPFLNPDTGRLICKFRLESVDEKPSDLTVRLYIRDEEPVSADAVEYGQRLEMTGSLWTADAVTNPYEFDFGEYLNRQGLSAYATAKLADVKHLEIRRDAHSAVIDVRRAVSRRIDALFPRNAALVRALVLGDRSLLDEEFRTSLNRTGTAHLISISGLHVTVLAALLSLVLGLFMNRRRASVVAVLLLIPYGALIGFNAPFVRAMIMFALVCFAPLTGHASDPVTRLSVAMLGYLLVHPLAVGDAGFVLSFSASTGILLLMPPLMSLTGLTLLDRRREKATGMRRLWLDAAYYFPSLLCASLAAQLATLPAVVAFFGVQPLLSLPFNLVCVPLCMAGYVLALAALILSAVWLPLGMLMAKVPDAIFSLLVSATRYSFRLPAAGAHFGRYPGWLTLIHWLVVLAASELSRIRLGLRRWMPFALLLLAGVSAVITLARAWPFTMIFMDAGQADCAIVRTRGHTYLFDAGDTYTPAADYLNATCLRLDAVFLSHPHQDHAAGLTDILSNFRPGAIYVPEGWFTPENTAPTVTEAIDLARDMDIPIIELRAWDEVALAGGATVKVFSPMPGSQPEEVNDMSMLTLLTCQGRSVLFTGDLSEAGEPPILPDADILKVAHHGSAKATSQRFLDAVTPQIAVVSVGENSFGHPSLDTLDKLRAAGARTLLTRELGMITLTPDGEGWHIETFLEASNDVE